MLQRAQKLAHPVNRLDALDLVLSAVFDDEAARRRVLHHLTAACTEAKSWRAARCLQRTAVLLGKIDPTESARVLALLPDGKYRRRAERELVAGGYGPRNFFW